MTYFSVDLSSFKVVELKTGKRFEPLDARKLTSVNISVKFNDGKGNIHSTFDQESGNEVIKPVEFYLETV